MRWSWDFFFFLLFRAMEVPRLGIELELQLLAYTTATARPDPSCIWTHTTTHGNAGSPTHWVRPGIKPTSSWILVGLITAEPQQEFQNFFFFFSHTCDLWKFPGQELNLLHSSSNTKSLICWATRKLLKLGIFIYLFIFGLICSMQKFLGPGLNFHHSSNNTGC